MQAVCFIATKGLDSINIFSRNPGNKIGLNFVFKGIFKKKTGKIRLKMVNLPLI